jgi:hypothetical protein
MGTKKTQKKLKKNIGETIDVLEATIRKEKTPQKKQLNIPMYDDSGYIFRQRMVWSTVILIGICIFGLWGWNMRTVFYDAEHGSLGKDTPLDSAGAYFNEAMLIAGKNDVDDTLTPTKATSTIENTINETVLNENITEEVLTDASSTLDTLIDTLQTGLITSSTVTTTNEQ